MTVSVVSSPPSPVNDIIDCCPWIWDYIIGLTVDVFLSLLVMQYQLMVMS